MPVKPRVLFVGLWYHHYTKAILDEIRIAGYDVDYVDIQPRQLGFKILKTLSADMYQRYLDYHHLREIRRVVGVKYDQVIFLQAHQVSLKNMTLLRRNQKQALFTLYNWDSLANHDYLSRVEFFDRILTFDKADAEQHGYEYLPLFSVRPIQNLRRDRATPRSVFMIGNIVKVSRFITVHEFAAYCKSSNIRFESYLVISPVVWWRMVVQGIWPKGVHFRDIPQDVFIRMTEESLAVFDVANHQQTGYTMRTIENLCAGKKIITNNKNVLEDYFYSSDRIICFDGMNFSGISEFLNIPLKNQGQTFMELSIQAFTQRLLGDGLGNEAR